MYLQCTYLPEYVLQTYWNLCVHIYIKDRQIYNHNKNMQMTPAIFKLKLRNVNLQQKNDLNILAKHY
jgi:hypothetical protein